LGIGRAAVAVLDVRVGAPTLAPLAYTLALTQGSVQGKGLPQGAPCEYRLLLSTIAKLGLRAAPAAKATIGFAEEA
jgi:hypothetical protein